VNIASHPKIRWIRDLSQDEFTSRLNSEGLGVRIGPFDAKIRARVDDLYETLFDMYGGYPLLEGERIFSFHVAIEQRRRFGVGKRLVRFTVDGRAPHEDMPAAQALAALEWGINLVIAFRAHCFLMLHSAVVERAGKAMLLPAWPGHGKTTLCAGLAHRGWRLFSDEFGLIRPETNELVPIPRPMPLKNESIPVIRNFSPDAEFGPTILNTRKGTIAHVKPPAASVKNASQTATARWIVFPRWIEDAPLSIQKISKAEGHMLLASNSFNYELLGERAFRVVRQLVTHADCFRLVYSDLEEAITALNGFVNEPGD
jgi:HprK-related kinase A